MCVQNIVCEFCVMCEFIRIHLKMTWVNASVDDERFKWKWHTDYMGDRMRDYASAKGDSHAYYTIEHTYTL